MAYYRTCPYCGSNLDPGEECECRKVIIEPPRKKEKRILSFLELGKLLDLMIKKEA